MWSYYLIIKRLWHIDYGRLEILGSFYNGDGMAHLAEYPAISQSTDSCSGRCCMQHIPVFANPCLCQWFPRRSLTVCIAAQQPSHCWHCCSTGIHSWEIHANWRKLKLTNNFENINLKSLNYQQWLGIWKTILDNYSNM